MQSSRLDHEPLLPGPPDTEHAEQNGQYGDDHDIPNARQAYQRGALHGMSALAVQALGVAFAALVWVLVLTTMPLTPLPLFGYHPLVQSLALLLLLQSVLTLQPTSGTAPAQKTAALRVHFALNAALVLPLFTVGVSIMWYLHDQPGASHFISWHGILGFGALVWAWLQVAIGVAIAAFRGRLVGGMPQARRLYKWHRLSGYLLLPLFLFTAALGATQTSWSQEKASGPLRTAVAICLSGVAIAMGVRLQPSKLPF